VIVLCRQRRFLDASIQLPLERLRVFDVQLDLEALAQQLHAIPIVCAGGRNAGAIGELPVQERFRWLIAPRSTILQASPVHCGLCVDPAQELIALFQRLVV
jgi:Protein of unknown function (DUF3037)